MFSNGDPVESHTGTSTATRTRGAYMAQLARGHRFYDMCVKSELLLRFTDKGEEDSLDSAKVNSSKKGDKCKRRRKRERKGKDRSKGNVRGKEDIYYICTT